jgi:hypothetical protein
MILRPANALRGIALLLLGSFTLVAWAQTGLILATLTLPGRRTPVEDTETVQITTAPTELDIHLEEQISHVQTGSLRFKINDDSATLYTTIHPIDHGFMCSIDLTQTSAPQLQPGDNLITVDFQDTWNQPHHAGFHLVLAQ